VRTRSAVLLALAFLALHLPFLPASLEDLDSINFALGLREFDVALHQPHPPGYPLYIFAAKSLALFTASELTALSLLAVLAGAFTVLAVWWLCRHLAPEPSPAVALSATALAVTAPLFWVTSARPLSDMPGLAAATASQALALGARSPASATFAAFAAGLGAGIRSQVVWLTLPLLAVPLMRQPGADRIRTATMMAAAYAGGAAIWAIPLLWLSGGPAGYLTALATQGAEDFTGVVMLWTTRTPRAVADALYQTFLAPWASVPLAGVMLALAALGFAVLAVRRRRTAGLIVLAFGPYVVFHLVFQETTTTRYALPVVIPIAFLALQGARALSPRAATAIGALLAAANLYVGMPQLSSYARMESPAFRLLADMRAAAADEDGAPVLAMHRREEFDFRRPIQWLGEQMPDFRRRLPSPPKHEWLEVVKFWNEGNREPVWFIADPLRSDLALFDRRHRVQMYRWPSDLSAMLGGSRPHEMDWHRIDRPGWYAGEGWDLTPETAGITREDRRGPGRAPINAWIRRRSGPVSLMIGGRNLGGAPARLHVTLDGRPLDERAPEPGFFLYTRTLPAGSLDGPGDYAVLAVAADSDQIAIEQFDAAPVDEVVYGFGEGWHEQEYNPRTGVTWRWSSDRAIVHLRSPPRGLTVRIAGEIEEASESTVTLTVGSERIARETIGRRFDLQATIPAAALSAEGTALTVESSASYVPAERGGSGDRRRLGLKVMTFEIRPAS
jgi:hypothetical protein